MIKTVGVVGAGTMGNGIAQVFAQAGLRRAASSTSRSRCSIARAATIEKSLAKFVEKGKLTAARSRRARSAGCTTATALDALADADYVVEAIVEDVDAKRALFAALDAITRPDVILASNTSSISITAARRRDEAAGPGARHALHEPGAADDAGRADPRPGDVRRVDARRRRSCARALGKTPVEAADYPGLHRQPHPDADDQRGDLRGDGRRRHAGGDRHGDEARA